MKRVLILSVNGVLLVACCWLAGGVVAEVAGAALAPSAPPAAAPQAAAPAAGRRWEDRQQILARNLFNVSTLAPRAVAPVEESENYEKTRLPLKLLGTVAASDPAQAWAAVEDTSERKELVVRVGDKLKGRAEVLRIERRRLVLQNGPRREELSLEDDKSSGRRVASRSPAPNRRRARPTARPSARAQANPQVQRLSENRFAVQRSDVQSMASDPTSLFSQARILPKYGEDGQMQGVQLNAIQPGSLFQQIGIQDGDTITQLNGIEVTGQEASMQLLQELTQADQFVVSVTGRDGNERKLEYEVQ